IRVHYSGVLSLWAAGTDDGQVFTSTDGSTWTVRIPKEIGDFRDITFNELGTLYYAIRENAGDLEILRSTDLLEWTVTATSSTYVDAEQIELMGSDLFISKGSGDKVLKVTASGTTIDDTQEVTSGDVTKIRVENGIIFALTTTG